MFIDHKKFIAAASASFCVRSSVASAVLCCAVLGAVHGLASAGDGPRREERQPQQQQQQQVQQAMPPQRQQQPQQQIQQVQQERQNDQREQREQPRHAEQRNFDSRADEQRRTGRLTPDERRDLRRQINEVSQDMYARPPRR